jgi:hypothetical protein
MNLEEAAHLESLIGAEACRALCEWTAGCALYVPSEVDGPAGRNLAERIGREEAARLIAWAGGSVLTMPLRFAGDLERRRMEVLALRRRGKTAREISREYRYEGRYSERQIWRILRGDATDDLFDSVPG